MEFLPVSISGWFSLIASVVATAYIIVQITGMKRKTRDEADDRMIGYLEKEVKLLKTQQAETTESLSKLKHERDLAVEILQGKDKTTVEFQELGFVAFQQIKYIHGHITQVIQNDKRS